MEHVKNSVHFVVEIRRALDRVDPRVTYRYLDAIIRVCEARGARVVLAGMLSLPKNGPNYIVGFNNIYPTLAHSDHVQLYPFTGREPRNAALSSTSRSMHRRFTSGDAATLETHCRKSPKARFC